MFRLFGFIITTQDARKRFVRQKSLARVGAATVDAYWNGDWMPPKPVRDAVEDHSKHMEWLREIDEEDEE